MITYTDKVQNAVNPLPVTEQFRAVDANEIKNEVNANITATSAAQVTANLAVSDFTVLVDGAAVTWNTDSKKIALAKLTSTQSFTLDMTNVASGSIGVFKLITNTASAITMTFDATFTNKRQGDVGEEAFTTYIFPASTGKEYILTYVVDGTTIHWTIGDVAWNSWTPVFAGFSVNPVVIAKYFIRDKTFYFYVTTTTNGTGASTTFAAGTTFTLPAGILPLEAQVIGVPRIVDNTAQSVQGIAVTAAGSDIVIVYKNGTLTAAWAASLPKAFSLTGFIHIM